LVLRVEVHERKDVRSGLRVGREAAVIAMESSMTLQMKSHAPSPKGSGCFQKLYIRGMRTIAAAQAKKPRPRTAISDSRVRRPRWRLQMTGMGNVAKSMSVKTFVALLKRAIFLYVVRDMHFAPSIVGSQAAATG
jgi:hypothetical protein